ncbi:MAG: TOBE domain-containing protein, partial [Actinomycetia bacterium]|nr:TOBE domain-containing protein [Actinomycetes bacterium]
GRLEQVAEPAELYARPATAFVAEFVGTMSRIPARRGADGLVEVLGQRLPVAGELPAGGELDALVRPEAVQLAADAQGSAIVVAASFLGAVTRLTVRLAGGAEVKADLPTETAARLPVGSPATVTLPTRPVLVDHRVR